MMDLDQIQAVVKQMLHNVDLATKPYMLIINPSDKKTILKSVPDLEERYVVVDSDFLESGKLYVIDRKNLKVNT